MKTLQHQTLLYDEDCPLCNLYTNGFIKSKMLDKNGRKPFSKLSIEEQNFIDIERASNEIALIDTKHNTVIYGIDSLLKVLGNSMPWIAFIGHLKPVKHGLKKLYSFISYNRKVIIPNKKSSENVLECVPSFNYKYRLFYIIFSLLITNLALFNFSSLLPNILETNFIIEGVITTGQIIFQLLFITSLKIKQKFNYIGNLMTVSLAGSLLLLVMLGLNAVFGLNQLTIVLGFLIIVSLMFLEHQRRVTLLDFPKHLSYTWILYRILVLILILNF
ncbi:DCC1-like thiol-disulfide oxidoreductase family protein [Ichthyenterobacterium sp. W332]|uniref:DCC1-like thiol-disulfide oxidoreductase family protein n=1 Tax=Microcosmobacter mediterraneus TaxID=3075607 RepID=A0ABU2YKR5_9FLAO|nr:DCC1-like thiol-disulfide oxidoreductase family protein [Ichthyenterobacterium sp. W332]MDT0558420.1 DCC1-like thiol-disulfide oxidoreductase family protein [Ichthyenterobacterium sp. W332]